MRNLLTKLFYPLFFLLFILSVFLIEGEYKFCLFALWSAFLFLFSFIFPKKIIDQKSFILILLVFLLSIFLIINVLFSSQIFLSIEKLLFYLVSLAMFVFFLTISREKFQLKLFFYYLSIITITLNIFVLFFTFFNLQPDIFPSMNFLVRSYGHNHYAAFLLLVIPVFWWQFLFNHSHLENWTNKKEIEYLSILLLFTSYLIIILSLARIVLLISLLQLILIFFLNKEIFSIINQNKLIKILTKSFIFIFLFAGAFFVLLSIPFNRQGDSFCPLIFTNKEICKPFVRDARFIYWQKALLIFKDNAFFGSGLKTFGFASQKFPIENSQLTSYAHNIFLHNLAEGGVLVGGLFIIFILYSLYKGLKVVKKIENPSLYKFLYLSVLASFFNALFDYDWHFFIIFSLTLIFLAIILQNDLNHKKITNFLSFIIYYFLLVLVTLFFAISSFLSQILYKQNKLDSIIQFIPYLDFQNRLMFSEKKLQKKNFETLEPFYRNDSGFIYEFILLDDITLKKQIELQLVLAEINPVLFINNLRVEDLDPESAKPLLDKFMEIAEKLNILNNEEMLDYWKQKNLSIQFFNLANQAYSEEKMYLASDFFYKSLKLNDYVMSNRKAVFLTDTDLKKTTSFFKEFIDFDPEQMGDYFGDYMSIYEKTLIYLFDQNKMSDFFLLSDAIFTKQPNFSWFLWRDLSKNINTMEEKQRFEQVHEHFIDLETWRDFWPISII